MHSICIRMHPYAPICIHTPYLRLRTPMFNTRSRRKSEKKRKNKNEFYFSITRSGTQNRSESNPFNQFRLKKKLKPTDLLGPKFVFRVLFGYLFAIMCEQDCERNHPQSRHVRRPDRCSPVAGPVKMHQPWQWAIPPL